MLGFDGVFQLQERSCSLHEKEKGVKNISRKKLCLLGWAMQFARNMNTLSPGENSREVSSPS